MLQALRICLVLLGLSAIFIALAIFFAGPEATAGAFEQIFNALAGQTLPPEHWSASMDSELRFYAVFWGDYGIATLAAAAELPKNLPQVPPLAAIFFAGGLGRLLSRLSAGPPRPFFTCLMIIELLLPVILLVLWLGTRGRHRRSRRGGNWA